jgi:hypothetical protein
MKWSGGTTVVGWLRLGNALQFYKKKLTKEQPKGNSNPKLTGKPVFVSMANHQNEID